MKLQKYPFIRFKQALPLFMYVIIFAAVTACKKDKPAEITDLTFPADTYYIPEGTEAILHINQGNKRYSLHTDDEAVIQSHADESSWPSGRIYVNGLKKGTATLTVKDEVNGKEVPLKIHVVDPFLVLKLGYVVPALRPDPYPYTAADAPQKIREEGRKLGVFALENILVLQRTENGQRFFVFKDKDGLRKEDVLRSGRYSLSPDAQGVQQLTFHFDDGANPEAFNLRFYNDELYKQLFEFSGSQQPAFKSTLASTANSTPAPAGTYFLMSQDFTSHFKELYPDVESVEVYQEVNLWSDYYNYGVRIGDGILK